MATSDYSLSSKLARGLADRVYEKRKASAFEIEKLIREQLASKNQAGVKRILSCLVKDFAYSPQPHARGGGLIALATSAIALGMSEIRYYLDDIVPPVLACFSDHDTQVKYYACEAMYNIAKVAKGEILRFFNDIFDALSKTAADTDKTVKKGSDLLNRLIIDIVSEEASTFVSQISDNPHTGVTDSSKPVDPAIRAFSLERFMPLLADRILTINPSTRVFLVNWLRVLDSLPELELIHYLPRFLHDVFMYLNDPHEEVRTVTSLLLTDFLVELHRIAYIKASPTEKHSHLLLQTLRSPNGRGPASFIGDGDESSQPNSPRPALSSVTSPSTLRARRALSPRDTRSPWRPTTGSSDLASVQSLGEAAAPTSPRVSEDPFIPPFTLDLHRTTTTEDQASIVDDLAGAISDPLLLRGSKSPTGDSDTHPRMAWVPRQAVDVDFAALVRITTELLDSPEREVQHTALQWIAKFILLAPSVVIADTPGILARTLPSLSHPNEALRKAAMYANARLYHLVQEMPVGSADTDEPTGGELADDPNASAVAPITPVPGNTPELSTANLASGLTDAATGTASSPGRPQSALSQDSLRPGAAVPAASAPATIAGGMEGSSTATGPPVPSRSTTLVSPARSTTPVPPPGPKAVSTSALPPDTLATPAIGGDPIPSPITPTNPTIAETTGLRADGEPAATDTSPAVAGESFNFGATVTTLIVVYSNGQEATRTSCVDWLLMLHRKAPLRMAKEETLVSNDGSFPVFLKIMSDPAEEVVKKNLQLLAQFTAYLDAEYFQRFMVKLLELFSTDRQLLETRGSLIIRRLCVSLQAELIYRTIAEILETTEDHEFASLMVQYLNTILITSPELAELRHRLKYLDTRDSQRLFAALYRSWCHSPVATFTLCLLAQAYEHAANLLPVFAEMEMTVGILVQVDKLVQLIESPVFTYLRLQLLEPDRYPYLYKCLYGILMLLPQSTAFLTLRTRLNSVSSLGYLHAIPLAAGGGVVGAAGVTTVAGNNTSGGSGGSSSNISSGMAATGGPGGTTGPAKRGKPGSAAAPVPPLPTGAPIDPPIRFNELLVYFRTMQLKNARLTQYPDVLLGRDPSSSSIEHRHRRNHSHHHHHYANGTSDGYPRRPSQASSSTGGGGGGRPSYPNSSGNAEDYQPPRRRSSGSPGLYGPRGRSPSMLNPPPAGGPSTTAAPSTTSTGGTRSSTRGALGPAVKAIRRTIGKR